MPLDPQAQALLAAMEAQGAPDMSQLSVSQARDMANSFREMQGDLVQVASVGDRTVPGPDGSLPVRIYTPHGSPRGAIVYFHGGGWVIGNIEVVDAPCRALADATGCVVVSAQYRLAPESAYPAAAEDCYAVTSWVAEHLGELGTEPAGIVVAGDSAGGNLAAVVALMARDRGGPEIALQALIYPATDLQSMDTESYRDNGEGYLLTAASMRWFRDHYIPDESRRGEPYASPARAGDLSGLPPAFIATMEFDPLRDDGERYGELLQKAGGQATVKRYDGQIHGLFWLCAMCDRYGVLVEDLAREIKAALG
ncbi:alpha/beta hydrolase [Geodermatophilus sabuli]|uniref:Acetyl esterase n=1 Tax=Geodermatophilus sabuli TaxID=1564158 RepID=A0A285E858_9ACTN|nr:alpha/beta hydrolase [Geodermatophilus sabuli]MBB3081855.1 acetyl esterase [Geodermatophilus sabuli]SNX95272.1 acetyl esterase [Geodermatophilus sabuli]